jgi:general secretion pathway protein H
MHRPTAHQRGFTLIEMLIVVAVMGVMIGAIAVGFGTTRVAQLTRATNQVAATIRYGFDKARTTGEHYRLRVDLAAGTFTLQKADGAMYLPATDRRDGKLVVADDDDLRDRERRDERASEGFFRSLQAQVFGVGGAPPVAARDAGAALASGATVPRARPPLFDSFSEENAIAGLSAPIELPEGTRVLWVRTADDLEPVTKGEAYLYFFPSGRTQLAHIGVADVEGTQRYTIKVQPLTGKVTIVDGEERLELPSDPEDAEDALGNRQQRRTL